MKKTARLAANLNAFFEQYAVSLKIVSFGSLFRFEPFGKYNPLLQPIEMDIFFYKLIEKGVYTWERRICFLSAAHTHADVDFIIGKVKEVITEMIAGGFFPEAILPEEDINAKHTVATVPLTAAEEQLWLLAQIDEGGSKAYNLTAAVQLDGPLQKTYLAEAIQAITARHESLRATISAAGLKQWEDVQNKSAIGFKELYLLPGAEETEEIKKWVKEKACCVLTWRQGRCSG